MCLSHVQIECNKINIKMKNNCICSLECPEYPIAQSDARKRNQKFALAQSHANILSCNHQ